MAEQTTRKSSTGIEVTEDGVARDFTKAYGQTMQYDHSVNAWFEWKEGLWRKDKRGIVNEYCRRLARSASRGMENGMKAVRRASFIRGVERIARSDPAHATTQDQWDTDPFLAGCSNGVIDLNTGELCPPDATHHITKSLGCSPADTEDCRRWLEFLDEATWGDQEIIRFFQQWFGYCLTGDTSEHVLLFIYGSGGNGKSVVVNVLAEMLGDYATTASMDTFTATRSAQHPTDLAALRGARMVSASETEAGKPWAEARIKAMTGGDKVSARFMRQDYFEYIPAFKLVIIGNHQPVLQNVDEAMKRRFRIVHFNHKPANPDTQLAETLRSELPGILRWALNGLSDWRENGLLTPKKVAAATDAYFSEQDVVGQWLEETCTVEPGNGDRWATRKDLFESWSRYAQRHGEEPKGQKWLYAALRSRGLEQGKRSGGERGFKGVEIKAS